MTIWPGICRRVFYIRDWRFFLRWERVWRWGQRWQFDLSLMALCWGKDVMPPWKPRAQPPTQASPCPPSMLWGRVAIVTRAWAPGYRVLGVSLGKLMVLSACFIDVVILITYLFCLQVLPLFSSLLPTSPCPLVSSPCHSRAQRDSQRKEWVGE